MYEYLQCLLLFKVCFAARFCVIRQVSTTFKSSDDVDTFAEFEGVYNPKDIVALLTALLGIDLGDREVRGFSMVELRRDSFNYDFVSECVVCGQRDGTLLISFKLRFDCILLKLRGIALSLYDGIDERCPFLLGSQEHLTNPLLVLVDLELHRIYFFLDQHLGLINFALFGCRLSNHL